MSRVWKVISVIVAAVILTTGFWADRARGADCDQECRDRRFFKFCGTGSCVEFVYPTCHLCQAPYPGWCVIRTDLGDSCVEPVFDKVTIIRRYSNCTELCSCTSATTVEASNMSGEYVEDAVARRVCI